MADTMSGDTPEQLARKTISHAFTKAMKACWAEARSWGGPTIRPSELEIKGALIAHLAPWMIKDLAELALLRGIVKDVAADVPHRKEYYSGGVDWHYCMSPGCTGRELVRRPLQMGCTAGVGLSGEDAMRKIQHAESCVWRRSVEATESTP